MPEENKKKSPFLFTTIHDLTTGIRKPSWFNSGDFLKFVQGDVSSYLHYFNSLGANPSLQKVYTKFISETDDSFNAKDPYRGTISNSSGFYNYMLLLSEPSVFLNHR